MGSAAAAYLPTQAEQPARALQLAGHPQVTVCVDSKNLSLALNQAGISTKQVKTKNYENHSYTSNECLDYRAKRLVKLTKATV
jgi:hypothetical protein